MKKFYISLLLFISISLATFSQTPTISMTTTLSINNQISIGISGNSASTPIQIDWGNGVKENFTIGTDVEFFGYPVKGSTILIWGAGITSLTIQSMNITALDFFEATSLNSIFCKNNQLTTLNLANCSALEFVECKQNLISSLTLPSTTSLTYVDCSDNKLSFATLPIKQASWTDYIYSPQKSFKLPKQVYSVNEEIDLSSQLTVNSNTTSYTWKTKGGTTLINGTDYNVTEGKFNFLKTYFDSLNCEMTNATFPSLTLTTKYIAIPQTPTVTMTTNYTVGNSFSYSIAAEESNTTIQVDWGNGTITSHTIGTSTQTISGTLTGNSIKVYGTKTKYLDVSNKLLTKLDVTNCTALNELNCKSNQLTTLDLSKNITLQKLDCRYNEIAALDILMNTSLINIYCGGNWMSAIDVTNCANLIELDCSMNHIALLDVSKNLALKNLTCYYNEITRIDISLNTSLTKFDCSNNKLKMIDVTNNIALQFFACSSNQLTSIDVSKNTSLLELYCSDNTLGIIDVSYNTLLKKLSCCKANLTNIDLSKNTALQEFWCHTNYFTFKTLPAKQSNWTGYVYSPQNRIRLQKNIFEINEIIDLSEQLIIENNTTTYKWKTINGVYLVKDVDYTEDNGKFTIIKEQNEIIYCELTNACFPDLTLNTDFIINTTKLPNIIMSTSQANGSNFSLNMYASNDNTLILVDWGDGIHLTSHSININETSIISGVLQSNTIKIYGLGIRNVFFSSKKLSSIDVTNNPSLTYLDCSNNNLTFATLPLKQQNWTTYKYSPQNKIILPQKNYIPSENIDLSSQKSVNGNSTSYFWKTKGGTTLTLGTDYNITNGVTKFLKVQTDSVYCQMINSTFPNLTLSTTNVKITQFHTDVNEISLSAKLYPNPVKDLLSIECKESIAKVEIYSVTGMRLFEKEGNYSESMNIPTGNLPTGMLIVKVYCKNGIIEKKVIKE